jgi:hypothetical protein
MPTPNALPLQARLRRVKLFLTDVDGRQIDNGNI